jgi:hypothetical protein
MSSVQELCRCLREYWVARVAKARATLPLCLIRCELDELIVKHVVALDQEAGREEPGENAAGSGLPATSYEAPEGQDVITVENKVSFLRPASGAALFCRAEVLKAGKRLIFSEAEVMIERDNKRLVVAKGLQYAGCYFLMADIPEPIDLR